MSSKTLDTSKSTPNQKNEFHKITVNGKPCWVGKKVTKAAEKLAILDPPTVDLPTYVTSEYLKGRTTHVEIKLPLNRIGHKVFFSATHDATLAFGSIHDIVQGVSEVKITISGSNFNSVGTRTVVDFAFNVVDSNSLVVDSSETYSVHIEPAKK